jgi:hypothetical protein
MEGTVSFLTKIAISYLRQNIYPFNFPLHLHFSNIYLSLTCMKGVRLLGSILPNGYREGGVLLQVEA